MEHSGRCPHGCATYCRVIFALLRTARCGKSPRPVWQDGPSGMRFAAGWRHPMTRPSRPAEKLPATAFSGSSFLFRKIARAMRTCGRSEIDRLNAIRTVTAGSATAEATEPGEDADQQAIVKDHENESDDASFDHLRGFLVNAPSTAPAPLLYPLPRSSRVSVVCITANFGDLCRLRVQFLLLPRRNKVGCLSSISGDYVVQSSEAGHNLDSRPLSSWSK